MDGEGFGFKSKKSSTLGVGGKEEWQVLRQEFGKIR